MLTAYYNWAHKGGSKSNLKIYGGTFKNCNTMIQGHAVKVSDVVNGPLVIDATPVFIPSSDKLTVTVGGTVGACAIVISGVVIALFVIRYASN